MTPSKQSKVAKSVSNGATGSLQSVATSPHSKKQGPKQHPAGNRAAIPAGALTSAAAKADTSDADRNFKYQKINVAGLQPCQVLKPSGRSPNSASSPRWIMSTTGKNSPKSASRTANPVEIRAVSPLNIKAAAQTTMNAVADSARTAPAAAVPPCKAPAGLSPRQSTTAVSSPRASPHTVTTATGTRPPWNSNSKVSSSSAAPISESACGSPSGGGNCSNGSMPGGLPRTKTFGSSNGSKRSSGSTSCKAAGSPRTSGAAGTAVRSSSTSGLRQAVSVKRVQCSVEPGADFSAGACSDFAADEMKQALSVYIESSQVPVMQPCDTPTRTEAADGVATLGRSSLPVQPVIHFHCVPATNQAMTKSNKQHQQQQLVLRTLTDRASDHSCYVSCDEEVTMLATKQPAMQIGGLMQHELKVAAPLELELYSGSSDGECMAVSFAGSTLQLRSEQEQLSAATTATTCASVTSSLVAGMYSGRNSDEEAAPADVAASVAAAVRAASLSSGQAAGVHTARRSSSSSGCASGSYTSTDRSPTAAEDADTNCLFSTPTRAERQLFSQQRAELTKALYKPLGFHTEVAAGEVAGGAHTGLLAGQGPPAEGLDAAVATVAPPKAGQQDAPAEGLYAAAAATTAIAATPEVKRQNDPAEGLDAAAVAAVAVATSTEAGAAPFDSAAAEHVSTTAGLAALLQRTECFSATNACEEAPESYGQPAELAALLPLLQEALSISDAIAMAAAAQLAAQEVEDCSVLANQVQTVCDPATGLNMHSGPVLPKDGHEHAATLQHHHQQQQEVGPAPCRLQGSASPRSADQQARTDDACAVFEASTSWRSSVALGVSASRHKPRLSCEMPLMDMLQRGDRAAVAAIADRLTRRLSATLPVMDVSGSDAGRAGDSLGAFSSAVTQNHSGDQELSGRKLTTAAAAATQCPGHLDGATEILFGEGSDGSYETDDDSVDNDLPENLSSAAGTYARTLAPAAQPAAAATASACTGNSLASGDCLGASRHYDVEVAACAAIALALQPQGRQAATNTMVQMPMKATNCNISNGCSPGDNCSTNDAQLGDAALTSHSQCAVTADSVSAISGSKSMSSEGSQQPDQLHDVDAGSQPHQPEPQLQVAGLADSKAMAQGSTLWQPIQQQQLAEGSQPQQQQQQPDQLAQLTAACNQPQQQQTQQQSSEQLALAFAFSAERNLSDSELMPDELPTPHLAPESMKSLEKREGKSNVEGIGQMGGQAGLTAVSRLTCSRRVLKAAKAQLKAAVAVKQQRLQLVEQHHSFQCSHGDYSELAARPVPGVAGNGVDCSAAIAAAVADCSTTADVGPDCNCSVQEEAATVSCGVLQNVWLEQSQQLEQAAAAATAIVPVEQHQQQLQGYALGPSGSLRIHEFCIGTTAARKRSSSSNASQCVGAAESHTVTATLVPDTDSNTDDFLVAVSLLSGSGASRLLPEAQALAAAASNAQCLLQQFSHNRRSSLSNSTTPWDVSRRTSSSNDNNVSNEVSSAPKQSDCQTVGRGSTAAVAQVGVLQGSAKHSRRPSYHSRQFSMDGSAVSGSDAAALAAIAAELDEIKRCSYDGSAAGVLTLQETCHHATMKRGSISIKCEAFAQPGELGSWSSSLQDSNHAGGVASTAAEVPTGHVRRVSYHSRQASVDGCSNVDWVAELQHESQQQQQVEAELSRKWTASSAVAAAALDATLPVSDVRAAAGAPVVCTTAGSGAIDARPTGSTTNTAATATAIATCGCTGSAGHTAGGVMSINSQYGQQLLTVVLPPQELYTLLELLDARQIGHYDSQQRRAVLQLLETEEVLGTEAEVAHAGSNVEAAVAHAGLKAEDVADEHSSPAAGMQTATASIATAAIDISQGASTEMAGSSTEASTEGGTEGSVESSTKGKAQTGECFKVRDQVQSRGAAAHSTASTEVEFQAAAASSSAPTPVHVPGRMYSTRCCIPVVEESSALTPVLPQADVCSTVQGMTFIWNPAYELSRHELQHANSTGPTVRRMVTSSAAMSLEADFGQLTSSVVAGAPAASAARVHSTALPAAFDMKSSSRPSSGSVESTGSTAESTEEHLTIEDIEGLPVLEQISSVVINDSNSTAGAACYLFDTAVKSSDGGVAEAAAPAKLQALQHNAPKSRTSTLSGSELSSAIAVLTELKGMLQEDTEALRSSLTACMLGTPRGCMQGSNVLCILEHVGVAVQQGAHLQEFSEHQLDIPCRFQGNSCGATACKSAAMGSGSAASIEKRGVQQQPWQGNPNLQLLQMLTMYATRAAAAEACRCKQPQQPLARRVLHQLYPTDEEGSGGSGSSTSSRGPPVSLPRTLTSKVRETLVGGADATERHSNEFALE